LNFTFLLSDFLFLLFTLSCHFCLFTLGGNGWRYVLRPVGRSSVFIPRYKDKLKQNSNLIGQKVGRKIYRVLGTVAFSFVQYSGRFKTFQLKQLGIHLIYRLSSSNGIQRYSNIFGAPLFPAIHSTRADILYSTRYSTAELFHSELNFNQFHSPSGLILKLKLPNQNLLLRIHSFRNVR